MSKITAEQLTPDVIKSDLAVLRTQPGDPNYDRGERHVEIVLARTTCTGRTYISNLTGRTAEGIKNAAALLLEELTLLDQDDTNLQDLRDHYGKKEGKAPNKATAHLPRLQTLEQALAFPYDQPFVFDTKDVPTPTGRFYKPYQTCVRVQCADGSDRVIHQSDRHQLVDEHGRVRSHEQVLAKRRERARERAKERRSKN